MRSKLPAGRPSPKISYIHEVAQMLHAAKKTAAHEQQNLLYNRCNTASRKPGSCDQTAPLPYACIRVRCARLGASKGYVIGSNLQQKGPSCCSEFPAT